MGEKRIQTHSTSAAVVETVGGDNCAPTMITRARASSTVPAIADSISSL